MGDRFDSGRLEAFSDGVFAIAITLLVLGISVPADAFDNLWKGIADQWPSYLAYATSFWTIGGLWLAHHGIFRRIRYADPMVLRTNLLLGGTAAAAVTTTLVAVLWTRWGGSPTTAPDVAIAPGDGGLAVSLAGRF